MRKEFFVKMVALVICLAFIGVSASGLYAAEKKASRIDIRQAMKRSVDFMTSVFPMFNNLFKSQKRQIIAIDNSNSKNVVKPTNDTSHPSEGPGRND